MEANAVESVAPLSSFRNRREAGRFLARRLSEYAGQKEGIVLALPRGGVPVGYEIALALDLPLDVFVVRKLGAPIHQELAMGAIASGGITVFNDDVIRRLGITPGMVEAAIREQGEELRRRERLYRGDRPWPPLEDKTVLLVDDGLATGASMQAAVRALRQRRPRRIVVAVPVGAPETCEQFENIADEVVCGKKPADFGAVGFWYDDFTQTTDEEVSALLNHRAHQQKVRHVLENKSNAPRDVMAHES